MDRLLPLGSPTGYLHRLESSRTECPKIRGYLCFFNEHVDEPLLDGVVLPRPLTPWSKDWAEMAATVPDPRGPVAWL
jgi:hypothetical protein